MAEVKKTSSKFSLNKSDFLKALLVALLGALITAAIQIGDNIQAILATGTLPSKQDLIQIAVAGLTAGGAYLVKNFFTAQQFITTAKAVLLVACIAGLSSCKTYYAFKAHSSFAVVQQPTTPNDTIAVEGKVWGIGDMAEQLIPPQSKAAQAWRNANKYCQVEITHAPTTLNDTAGVRVTCHSLGTALENIKPKK